MDKREKDTRTRLEWRAEMSQGSRKDAASSSRYVSRLDCHCEVVTVKWRSHPSALCYVSLQCDTFEQTTRCAHRAAIARVYLRAKAIVAFGEL